MHVEEIGLPRVLSGVPMSPIVRPGKGQGLGRVRVRGERGLDPGVLSREGSASASGDLEMEGYGVHQGVDSGSAGMRRTRVPSWLPAVLLPRHEVTGDPRWLSEALAGVDVASADLAMPLQGLGSAGEDAAE